MIPRNIKFFKTPFAALLKQNIKEMNTEKDNKHLDQAIMRIKGKRIVQKSIIEVLTGFGKSLLSDPRSVIKYNYKLILFLAMEDLMKFIKKPEVKEVVIDEEPTEVNNNWMFNEGLKNRFGDKG
jgi:hypothetical protein